VAGLTKAYPGCAYVYLSIYLFIYDLYRDILIIIIIIIMCIRQYTCICIGLWDSLGMRGVSMAGLTKAYPRCVYYHILGFNLTG